MENNWASENLLAIRTLMERSSIYRRALAPIMIVTGAIGCAASLVHYFVEIRSNLAFAMLWMVTACVAFITALLLVRRQALQDAEPFWSMPTRRVWQSLLPNFFIGLAICILFSIPGAMPAGMSWILPPVWMLFYGSGLHAAGFFMQRSIKLFGWMFVILGALVLVGFNYFPRLQTAEVAHDTMGIFFGAVHLAFGIYLFFTETRKKAA